MANEEENLDQVGKHKLGNLFTTLHSYSVHYKYHIQPEASVAL